MTKIKNNPLLKGASGKLGDVIVFRQVRGGVVMANKPKQPTSFTEKQVVARTKFQRATSYAKRQMLNPETKAMYATGVNDSKISAYLVALTDYIKAPEIQDVSATGYTGAIGQTVEITATDDFRIKSVQVSITSAAGVLVESGEAVLQPDSPDKWTYTSTAANPALVGTRILVTARDTAGNATAKEILK